MAAWTGHTHILTFQLTTKRLILFAGAALIGVLYLADLSGMGLVSKDEPRYADIGRAMARTGDWITPKLWGQPWFEKPPLLYWLIGIGFKSGLGPEVAPRLPVALFSLGFLLFFWFQVRSIWDERIAAFSTGILATSAGWLALSHVAITDVPVAAMFTAAVLLAMAGRRAQAGAALGFAVLAKSLPPLVLFLPVLAVDYRNWREWVRPAPVLVFLAIAVPWHLTEYLRHGYELIRILFIQQQFGRFVSPERQHIQKWWFYLPVIPLLLYPWFPLLLFAARDWRDKRTGTLLSVVLFGMLFFSGSVNKLPSYVLPLMPATCILMGIGLARTSRPGIVLIWPAILLGLLPFARSVVPVAIASRLRSAPLHWSELAAGLGISCALGISLILLPKNGIFGAVFGLACVSFLWFQFAVFPAIDRLASARPEWRQSGAKCTPGLDRGTLYGLLYYADGTLAACDVLDQTPAPVVR